MMMLARGLCFLALAMATTGCVWRTNEEERQIPSRSYVRPFGRTAGTTISLHGKKRYTFKIDENHDEHGVRYGIDPDTYRVTVRRGDQILLNRVLFIADGETRDIPIR